MSNAETVWTFNTKRFEVSLELSPSTEPYDGDDEDGEIARKLNSGFYCMFDSFVKVTDKETGFVLGRDSLGMSVYETVSDFWTGENRNGYFRDMVRQACNEARKNVYSLCNSLKVNRSA